MLAFDRIAARPRYYTRSERDYAAAFMHIDRRIGFQSDTVSSASLPWLANFSEKSSRAAAFCHTIHARREYKPNFLENN